MVNDVVILFGCPYNPVKEIFVDLVTNRTAGGATTTATATACCCPPPLPRSMEEDDDVNDVNDDVIHLVYFDDGLTLVP